MKLRNGPDGYGFVTKTLHWATVALLLVQFVVGYLMDVEDGSGRGRGRGRGGEALGLLGADQGRGRGRGRGGDDDLSLLSDLDGLLALHVALGVTILVLALLRTLWRATTPLPPWAETLSARERRAAHLIEKTLLGLLYAVPLTGLVLVLGGYDDLVPLHVAAHLAFYAVLAAHLVLVLGHRFRGGDSLLGRMA